MQFLTRIGLFVVVNALVVLTITIVLDVLGIQPYLTEQGIDVTQMAIFCFFWGMIGSMISLFLSKSTAKKGMRLQMIDPDRMDPQSRRIYQMVEKLATQADLPKTPEVGIWNTDAVNAFATGASKRSALVAISSGLLAKMSDPEIEGVLAHEISHIRNGDMVTMTLLQGIVNAFAMFLARIVASVLSRKERSFYMLAQLLQMVLMVLGSIVICWFSRKREFKADEGGAALAGRQKMVDALKKLAITGKMPSTATKETVGFQQMMIFSKGKLAFLFMTHPPIEERIEHLSEITII